VTLVAIIEVAGAHKTYRRWRRPPERALDGLDLSVPEGGVFGFLGPNGSGKTTTIRLLLGLIRPDAGSLRMLGRPVPHGLPAALTQVGALVETPTFFPGFSGRENLRLLTRVAGLPDTRVEECLERVELRERGADRYAGYSLGMKQRLGIAAALLKRPRLLVLDEPSNGLDPAGMREVRNLIGGLGRDGHTTVFLSSHLLGEVQAVCDNVAILARGRCIRSGRVADVLASGAPGGLRVRLHDLPSGAAVLAEAGLTVTAHDGSLVVKGAAEPAAVTRLLAERGLYLSELTPVTADLESVFLDLTEEPQP
jgi:ABC-2 type transport system ATP-binding protein